MCASCAAVRRSSCTSPCWRASSDPPGGARELPGGDRALVGAHVIADHPVGREALLREPAALAWIDLVGALERCWDVSPRVDDQTAALVVHHLGHGAVPGRDH